MVELEYVGEHQEKGVYDVKEKDVDDLLNTGVWKRKGVVKSVVKKEEKPLVNKEYLERLIDEMGWKSFQKYAFKKWGVKDSSQEELIDEILEKQ